MSNLVNTLKTWFGPAKQPELTQRERQCRQLVFNMRDCTDAELGRITTIVTNAMVREGRRHDAETRTRLHDDLKPDENMLSIEQLEPFRTNSPYHDIHAAIEQNPIYKTTTTF